VEAESIALNIIPALLAYRLLPTKIIHFPIKKEITQYTAFIGKFLPEKG